MDYRFCPEPDLPPLFVDDEHVDALKAALPELPEATMTRFSRCYALPEHLSRLIVCAAGGASGAPLPPPPAPCATMMWLLLSIMTGRFRLSSPVVRTFESTGVAVGVVFW